MPRLKPIQIEIRCLPAREFIDVKYPGDVPDVKDKVVRPIIVADTPADGLAREAEARGVFESAGAYAVAKAKIIVTGDGKKARLDLDDETLRNAGAPATVEKLVEQYLALYPGPDGLDVPGIMERIVA